MKGRSDLHRPALDHVVVNARDQLDDAVATYTSLGFFLTPRGYHSLGSINHLAVFNESYLELAGVPPGDPNVRPELAHMALGLNGYVFRTERSAELYDSLIRRNVAADPPGEFSRPVDLQGTWGEAKFRTIRLEPSIFPVGRVYFCQHLTPQLVWRHEWQDHPNGAVAIRGSVWVVEDLDRYVTMLSRIFSADGFCLGDRACAFAVGDSSIEMYEHARFVEVYGSAVLAPDSRREFMACIRVQTRSIDVTKACLTNNRVSFERGRLESVVVPSVEAFDVVVEFCE